MPVVVRDAGAMRLGSVEVQGRSNAQGSRQRAPAITVVYPGASAAIAASDSNFIFGSVWSGSARLTINGAAVRVHPNGAFLAWLPLPRETSSYALVATLGRDTVRLTHPVRLASLRLPLALTGPLVVDSASVSPRRALALYDDEQVRVSMRAPANARVFVAWSGGRRELQSGAAIPRGGFASARVDTAAASAFAGDAGSWATSVDAGILQRGARLVAARGRDTVSFTLGPVTSMDSISPLYGMLGAVPSELPDTDRFVIARPLPGGTYKWMLLPGTIVQVTGRDAEFVRVRLDSSLDVWVPEGDVQLMPDGFAPAPALPVNSRLVSAPGWVDLVIPTGVRPPYHVEAFDDRIELTLHGVRANLDNVTHVTRDTLVRSVVTSQLATDRARITLNMPRRPFGYLVLWDKGNFVLRVRRPPVISATSPLRGLTIAVDAGHPPAGATGPTGLYEGVATLQIARRVKTALEARGARVVMTRTTDDPVALADRPVMARRANAHAMVSIHLNALPDGINPFTAHGTSTYYFQNMSATLAREVQLQLVRRLQLRDLGYMYNTFAVTRPTWMPSVLCEGAFIMIPEQEAAIRTAEFQASYAVAVVDGLQRYFASLGTTR